MVEPYFAAWLKTRKELSKEESLLRGVREALPHFSRFEKAVFLIFGLCATVLLLLAIMSMFEKTLLLPLAIGFVPFLLLAAFVNRIGIARDRRVPEWRLAENMKMARRLRVNLKNVGLTNRKQLQLVKDDAIRIVERKTRLRDSIIRTSIEITVLVALVWVLNTVVILVEHDLPLEVAGMLVALSILLSVCAVAVVYLVWRVVDQLGALPTPQLLRFVDDLSFLVVQDSRTKHLPARRHRTSPRKPV